MSTLSDANGPPAVSQVRLILYATRLTYTQSQQDRGGPPFAPTNAGLGGFPDVIPDVPITAVFLVLYLVFGIIHIKILKSNKGRGHKFIFNGALLGMPTN